MPAERTLLTGIDSLGDVLFSWRVTVDETGGRVTIDGSHGTIEKFRVCSLETFSFFLSYTENWIEKGRNYHL